MGLIFIPGQFADPARLACLLLANTESLRSQSLSPTLSLSRGTRPGTDPDQPGWQPRYSGSLGAVP